MSYMSDMLFVHGVAAAKAGDTQEARSYLERLLRMGEATLEQEAEAWYWLGKLATQPEKRRDYFENVLAVQPFHPEARRELAILDGRLDPAQIVDPDRLLQTNGGPALCPECGAPLVFAPDGRERYCERCGWDPDDLLALAGRAPDDLLRAGIAAVKAGERKEARRYLEAAVCSPGASTHQKVHAWLWMSGVVDAPERRRCLEAVLRLDPGNVVARRGLQHLAAQTAADGEAEPVAAEARPSAAGSRRFVCRQCGARMSFSAGGHALECDHCGFQQSLLEALKRTPGTVAASRGVQEQDFLVDLATAKGHVTPTQVQPFKCRGCGASFVLAPGVLSMTCTYCGSPHVVELPTQDVGLPEAVLPFGISREAADRALTRWLEKEVGDDVRKRSEIRGLYLPAWTFDVGGTLNAQRTVHRFEGQEYREYVEQEAYSRDLDDLLVPANPLLPAALERVLRGFDLGALVPYDERYLAGWPAAVNEISASDASLVARQEALRRIQESVDVRLSAVSHIITVYAYKLILLPIWMARYEDDEGDLYRVVVNGQVGEVVGQRPHKGFFEKLWDGLEDFWS